MNYSFMVRLQEPSTHAGLCGILLAASSFFPQYAIILQPFAALLGVSAAIVPEVNSLR